MPLIRSTDNPVFRRLKRLADSARACRSASRTLIEGMHLLNAAADAAVPLHVICVRASGVAAEAQALADRLAQHYRLEPIVLAASLYDAISPVQHGVGVLGEATYVTRPPPTVLTGDGIFLDGVQDPGNVGTLLRTAAAAGVNFALLGEGCAYAGAPKVMRAAMGAHFVLSVHDGATPDEVRRAFAGTMIAADATGGASLFGDWRASQTLWMFGGEGRGLRSEALAVADLRLNVPIDAAVESLNVAAAAAVCLFEQRRRRLSAV